MLHTCTLIYFATHKKFAKPLFRGGKWAEGLEEHGEYCGDTEIPDTFALEHLQFGEGEMESTPLMNKMQMQMQKKRKGKVV